MRLKCLKCDAQLTLFAEQYKCSQCGSEWPIRGGIPRFFQAPEYYWGEVGRQQAQELLAAARAGNWIDAVYARFPKRHPMAVSLLDQQRTSWAPMLGINERSVVLDVGSGYGAITHSLARLAGEVYSVEAIPERIEFTQERVRQDGLQNVRLIQASATALPLVEDTFDVIIVNGVLEWAGEWDLNGDPRTVQLRFLRKLCGLLKEDGVLLLGIENRFGYGMFLGHNDHSGIPYTSLVPRWAASLMLRFSTAPHHRTRLNRDRKYRTYTYSERGYRKLLGEAGFGAVSSYWADPGYNQPYHLIPLSRPQWMREHLEEQLSHPARNRPNGWRRRVKRILGASPLLSLTVPEFVFFASKRSRRLGDAQRWMETRLSKSDLPWAIYAPGCKPKSVVRLGDPNGPDDLAYVKVMIGRADGMSEMDAEQHGRAMVREALGGSTKKHVDVPHSYGGLFTGGISYRMESAARGVQLSTIIHQDGYFGDLGRVQQDLEQLGEHVLELTGTLQKIVGVPPLDPAWRQGPAEFRKDSTLSRALERSRYFGYSVAASRLAWVQHGDLSVENMFVDRTPGRVTVFDWSDLRAGFPPLYDFFHFLFSTGYLPPSAERTAFSSEVDRWITSFKAIFLGKNGIAQIAHQLILNACERFSLRRELIPALLVEYLLLRTHFYSAKSAVMRATHLQLLQLCLTEECSIFGEYRIAGLCEPADRELISSVSL